MWPTMSQSQQMHAKSKELDSRCRLCKNYKKKSKTISIQALKNKARKITYLLINMFWVSERIAEGLRILDHDPSVALYRLQGIRLYITKNSVKTFTLMKMKEHSFPTELKKLFSEHVNRNLPALITRRIALDQQHSSLDVVHSDLDNAIR